MNMIGASDKGDMFGLGRLAEPGAYCDAIDGGDHSAEWLLGRLRMMVMIRKIEEAIGDLVVRGEVKCPCHLSIGQEAIPAGVSAHLRASDRVFGGHRSHGHYLALGGDPYKLLAETLGRDSGCARGRGGSMHLTAPEAGFMGSVPIVGETVSIAVGAALAAKMDGGDDIAVAYFGDGAIEEGSVQESLNLASIMKLPVLFVCENNFHSSHLDIKLRQPGERVARFADAHKIEARTIDGNDVVAVADSAGSLIGEIRKGAGPAFIEAVTYRWRGHVGPREDVDVGLRRGLDQLALWKGRDPIRRLFMTLERDSHITQDAFERLSRVIEADIAEWTARALAAPLPDPSTMLDYVYSQPGLR